MYTVFDSPIGELTLVAWDGMLSGLYMPHQRYRPDDQGFGEYESGALPDVVAQLTDYFAGEQRSFDVSLRLRGTAFQRQVWATLQTIPYGHIVTYRQLAKLVGRPQSARAVGAANGRNPIGVIVPCHRVVGSDGSLTGYAGGVARKQYLLELEQRSTPIPR